jgi:predicted amino acid racemase
MTHQQVEYGINSICMKIVSGGNSSMLPLTMYNDLGKINELRIGETLFRGVDTTTDIIGYRAYMSCIRINVSYINYRLQI